MQRRREVFGGGGVRAVQRPGGKKREVMLQLERTRGWKGNKKGQHQLTDVIRNDGNMARTASLSLSPTPTLFPLAHKHRVALETNI